MIIKSSAGTEIAKNGYTVIDELNQIPMIKTNYLQLEHNHINPIILGSKAFEYKDIFVNVVEDTETNGDTAFKEYNAIHEFAWILSGMRKHDSYTGYLSLEQYLNMVLKDTGFTYQVEGGHQYYALQFENLGDGESHLDMFFKMLSRWNTEFELRGKKVYITHQRGRLRDKHVGRYKMNIIDTIINSDITDGATAVWGYFGKKDEENPENSTYREFYWQIDELVEQYGIRYAKPYSNENITQEETMIDYLNNILLDSWKISTEIDIAEITDEVAQTGDEYVAVDERLGITLNTRIQKLESIYDADDKLLYQTATLGTVSFANTSSGSSSQLQEVIEKVKKDYNDRITDLKQEFDNRFNDEVTQIEIDFNELVNGVRQEIQADYDAMSNDFEQMKLEQQQNLADFSNTFTEYADNIRTETKQYADILNASVTQSVTTLRSALDNAEGTIATITNDLSSVKTQVGTIGRDYVKSAELNVLSGEIQKRVLKSEYDAFTDTTTRKLNETVSTAEGNSTLIAQATGRIDDLENWRADKGQAIEETIDSYSRKIWRDDIDNLQIGGRNLLENSANMNNSWETEVSSYKYLLRPRIQSITPKVKVGDTLTFSLDIEAEDKTAIRIYDSNGNPSMSFGNHNFVVQKGKQRISFTTTLKESSSKSTVWYMDIYNNNNGVKFSISKIKIEKGNKATDWTPAPEDAEARITEIKQTADRVALQAQAIADDYLKQSGVVVTGDKVQIGSKIVNGDVLASLITVSPSAINVITDNINLKGSLTVTNQIKTMALEAVYADIAKLRTNVLVADVITANMVKFDTALIEKFTSSTAFINSLTAKSAFINNAKVTELISTDGKDSFTLAGGQMNWVRSNGQSMQLGIDGIYMRNSDGSTRFQLDRTLVASSALGTTFSNVYLGAEIDGEARVVQARDIPGDGLPESYRYLPIRALALKSPPSANMYIGIDGTELRLMSLSLLSGGIYRDLRAQGLFANSLTINTLTSGNHLYLRPRDGGEVFITKNISDDQFSNVRALEFRGNALRVNNLTNGSHLYLSPAPGGEVRITHSQDSQYARLRALDLRANELYPNTGNNLFLRSVFGYEVQVMNGATENFGTLRAGTLIYSSLTQSSLETLKTNINPMRDNVLELYKNELELYSFAYKEAPNTTTYGVVIGKGYKVPKFWLKDGKVKVNDVIFHNAKAIQELAHENNELKSEIAELKSQINKIMEMIA